MKKESDKNTIIIRSNYFDANTMGPWRFSALFWIFLEEPVIIGIFILFVGRLIH